MLEPVEINNRNSTPPVKVSWTSILLSFSTTAQRASEMEGDLIEEGEIYSLRNRQKSLFRAGCGRINAFYFSSNLLKNK